MTTAPILGIIIPPSISMILYAMVTNDPIEALFLTGYVPGILIIVCMSLYCWVACRKQGLVPPAAADAGRILPPGPAREHLGAAAAGADQWRHLLRHLHRQRGGGGRLLLRLLRRDVHPQGHEIRRGQEGHRLLGGDLGGPADDRRRRLGVRRIPDLRPGAGQGRQRRGRDASPVPGSSCWPSICCCWWWGCSWTSSRRP